MRTALWLLAAQGAIGAFDTLYFHEWRGRLTARGPVAHPELRLHAARAFLYALIFASLPVLAFRGGWAVALVLVLGAEIVITLRDFMVEDRVRASFGGVLPGSARHTRSWGSCTARCSRTGSDAWGWWTAPTARASSPPRLGRAAAGAMGDGERGCSLRESVTWGGYTGSRTAAWPGRNRHPESGGL